MTQWITGPWTARYIDHQWHIMSRPTERFPDGKALAEVNRAMIGDDGVACLMAAAPEMATALRAIIYETTHLSAMRDDGSHDCRISAEALANARAALAKAGMGATAAPAT